MKIRSKLFVLFVSLILTSFLAASFVSINVLSAAMIREIRSHLEDNSVNLMKKISTGSSNSISDIVFLGNSMNVFPNQSSTDLGKKLDLLKKFIGTHKDYSSVSIYNKTGIMIAGQKGFNIGENVSHESFFQRAIQGYIYRGVSTGKEIVLSGPLYDKSGKINEILVLTYPLEIEHASTGLQSNLRISLLSDDGKVIYSNNSNSNYGNRPLSNASAAGSLEYQPIFRLIKGSNNTVESAVFNDTRFPSGNGIFVATKESSDSQNPDIIKNKWLLVSSLDTEEAFKGVLSIRNMFIIITVIVLAIAIIAIDLVVNRTISIPLTKLKNAVIEIGKGNLDPMIASPSTVDEIGELSSQFGKMRERIKARTEELVRRDKELETANEQLKEKDSILEKTNEELRSLDRLKDEFINVAAHELRTPIQPVLILTQTIRSKINDTELRELLDIVIRNANRLHLLAEEILDTTRIESQSLKLNKELFNLYELISTIAQDTKREIERDHINITLSYESKKDLFVEADRYRITQVISNLLDNAIKFSKEEGTVSITLQKKEDNKQEVIVSVKDTGTGIPSDILPKIFSKFVSKSEKGTGLGLFISKSIVEAHGGRIWAENNIDGKGATLSFSLLLR